MDLKAERSECGEGAGSGWAVIGIPSVNGGVFANTAVFDYPRVMSETVRLVGVSDALVERISAGDPAAAGEIMLGPDETGIIQLIGCAAVLREPTEKGIGGKITQGGFTTNALQEFPSLTEFRDAG